MFFSHNLSLNFGFFCGVPRGGKSSRKVLKNFVGLAPKMTVFFYGANPNQSETIPRISWDRINT